MTGETNAAASTLDYAPATLANSQRLRPLMRVLLGIGALDLLVLIGATIELPRARCSLSSSACCAANLRSIGMAVEIYAAEHGGRFPDTLAALQSGYVRDARIFTCPSSDDTPAEGATPEARAADLIAGGHLSYVYAGGGLDRRAGPDVVLAFEWPHHHAGERDDGTNVLFANGRVERMEDVRPILDQYAAGVTPVRFSRGAGR